MNREKKISFRLNNNEVKRLKDLTKFRYKKNISELLRWYVYLDYNNLLDDVTNLEEHNQEILIPSSNKSKVVSIRFDEDEYKAYLEVMRKRKYENIYLLIRFYMQKDRILMSENGH